MSKKDNIKEYLKGHKGKIAIALGGGICLGAGFLIGFDSGARAVMTDIAGQINDMRIERNDPERVKVVGNIIKGFHVDKIET